ncbi:hypothetical protein [Meiothermus granaticius]|uniref:Uncharacterized protein n=1 Tax=Meiothermus granaticius NBRC 107808 TaxID=1227551 RepID=A0A399F754_9DEIN|nr:hypothetical protein [Meiothermus granaticius]RIH92517.1 hypothetical protein Mgrana_01549 [Meiothermus granaticius NBRC 107808]GEM87005.1 hypothetical protein MGR01S_16300 [Meiothermus granaticius NBRC 107808]
MDTGTPLWSVFVSAALLALSGAVLRVLMESVRSEAWKRALQVLSSAFWGGLAAIFLASWLKVERSGLLAAAVLLGWVGYQAVLEALLKGISSRIGAKEGEKK